MQPARLHEPAGAARVARRGSGRSRMSNRKILLVEDNADLAHILPIHLQDLNCAVEVARTGDSGLELALAGEHDLILLDLVLPGIGGLEVCQRLRHERKHTPILMLTSKSARTTT